jgi:hypothetical protein
MKYRIEIKLKLKKDAIPVSSSIALDLLNKCLETHNIWAEGPMKYKAERIYGFVFCVSNVKDENIHHRCHEVFLMLQKILNANVLKYSLQEW